MTELPILGQVAVERCGCSSPVGHQAMGFQLGLLALATILLSRSDSVGKDAPRVPEQLMLPTHFPTQRVWSGFQPAGSEDTDQFSALDWLSHHVEETKRQRCFGFLRKRRDEDGLYTEEGEREEEEEGSISEEGEAGEAGAQPELARSAWALRAFCGVFCGKWHLLSANRRARAKVASDTCSCFGMPHQSRS